MACDVDSEDPQRGDEVSHKTSTAASGVAEDDYNPCYRLPAAVESFFRCSPQPLCVIAMPIVFQKPCIRTASEALAAAHDGGAISNPGPYYEAARRTSSSFSSTSSHGLKPLRPCDWAASAASPGISASYFPEMLEEGLPEGSPPTAPAAPINLDDADLSKASLLYSNEALAGLCGYSLEELRRSGLELLLRPPLSAGTGAVTSAAELASHQSLQLLKAALASGSPALLELPCYHSSGRLLWCTLSLSPVDVKNGGDVRAGAGASSAVTSWASTAKADVGWRRHGSPGLCMGHVGSPATGCGSTRCGGAGGAGCSHSSSGGRRSSSMMNSRDNSINIDSNCDKGGPNCGQGGHCCRNVANTGGGRSSIGKLDSCESYLVMSEQDSQQSQERFDVMGNVPRQQQQEQQQRHEQKYCQQRMQHQRHYRQTQLDVQQQGTSLQQAAQLQNQQLLRHHERETQHQQQRHGAGGDIKGLGQGCTAHRIECEEDKELGEDEELDAGSGVSGQVHRLIYSGTHEWARRCQQEQDERRLRLWKLQLQEQAQHHQDAEYGEGRDQQGMVQRRHERGLLQALLEAQGGQDRQALPRDGQPQKATWCEDETWQQPFLVIFSDVTELKQLQQLQCQQQEPHCLKQASPQNTLPCRTSSPADKFNNPATASLQGPAPAVTAVSRGPVHVPDLPHPRRSSASLVSSLAASLAAGDCASCCLHNFALDALREGITVADMSAPDQPIVYTNKAFLAMTGYSREEVLGRNCRFLQGPDTDPAAILTIREALSRRQSVTVQLLNYTKAGVAFWNELRLEPVVAPGSGQLLGYIGVQNDVTELLARKQSEAQLRNSKEAAESAAEAKSQFLANMSHEIRTPLNGMIATAQLLLGSQLTPEQRELTETILDSGSTLLGVLGDILDFSKIDHGSLELQRHPMCLRQATEACMHLVAAEAAKKGLSLAYLLDDEALERPLLGDPVRIRQVLANLLSNAVKFTERGEVVVRVSVERSGATKAPTATGAATATATAAAQLKAAASTAVEVASLSSAGTWSGVTSTTSTRPSAPSPTPLAADFSNGNDGEGDGDGDGEYSVVHVAVSDTGIGIGEESAGKLFQHFRQGTETMSRRYGGTGLGLAISKRLAQLMEGDIWVESRLGIGSTFHFTLRAQWTSVEGPWPCSPSRSAASTPMPSSDCTPRSSADEGHHSGATTVAAAAALGLDSSGACGWSNSPSGQPARLSNSSVDSSGSGRQGRMLRTSPWLPDGTPIDRSEKNSGGDATGAASEAPISPVPHPPTHRNSASGDSGSGNIAYAAGGEVGEERLLLVGRKVLIDVSHAATSTQVWNSCRQLGLAAVQANACMIAQLSASSSSPSELLAVAAAPGAIIPSSMPSSATSSVAGVAATPPGQHVGQTLYDILVVSMDRLVPALKAGWKGRPVVALGDRELLPPTLQPFVVVLTVPVWHGRLATAMVKATALLRWNGTSAPKLSNTPIPSESIQTLKSWRLKRGSDWEGINRRTSLDNSALERTNVLLRGGMGPAGAAAAGAGCVGAGKSCLGTDKASPGLRQQQHAPIPEHAELSSVPDDAHSSDFRFRLAAQASQQVTSTSVAPSAAFPLVVPPDTAATPPPVGFPPKDDQGGVAVGNSGQHVEQQQYQHQQQQLRILIAEDNKVNQKVVLKVLQQILRGCQPPDVVENGLQVLQALQKKTYDLILMDIHMPEMDGLEASKRIQETYKPEERPRIIALSADTVQTLHDRCREAGIEAFLVKPFRIEELARVMRTGAPRPHRDKKLDQDAASCGPPFAV